MYFILTLPEPDFSLRVLPKPNLNPEQEKNHTHSDKLQSISIRFG
jgi:hypothetical protein